MKNEIKLKEPTTKDAIDDIECLLQAHKTVFDRNNEQDVSRGILVALNVLNEYTINVIK